MQITPDIPCLALIGLCQGWGSSPPKSVVATQCREGGRQRKTWVLLAKRNGCWPMSPKAPHSSNETPCPPLCQIFAHFLRNFDWDHELSSIQIHPPPPQLPSLGMDSRSPLEFTGAFNSPNYVYVSQAELPSQRGPKMTVTHSLKVCTAPSVLWMGL